MFEFLMLQFVMEFIGNKFHQYMNTIKSFRDARMMRRISRLQQRATKFNILATVPQNERSLCSTRRQIRLKHRADRLTKRSEKLQESIRNDGSSVDKLPQGTVECSAPPIQLEYEPAEHRVKGDENDLQIPPPAYDDIYQQQPPPYEEVNSSRRSGLQHGRN